LLRSAVAEIPALVVEQGGQRKAMSPRAIDAEEYFWTVDCDFFDSVDALLRELPKNISLSELGTLLDKGQFNLPEGALVRLDTGGGILLNALLANREAQAIRLNRTEKRIDLKWCTRTDPALWIVPTRDWPRPGGELGRILEENRRVRNYLEIRIGRSAQIELIGAEDEMSVEYGRWLFLLPQSPLCECLVEEAEKNQNKDGLWFVLSFIEETILRGYSPGEAEEVFVNNIMPRMSRLATAGEGLGIRKLQQAIRTSNWRSFSTRHWRRYQEPEY
jgi:hypothetical protein